MYYPIKPRGNRKVINTYVFHNSFNDKQINRIKTLLSDKWNKAEVETGDSGRYSSDIRVNDEQTLIPDKDGFPYTQIANVVAELNRDWWNFDVTGFNFLTDHPSAFKYNVGGKFDWHYDFTHSEPTRKLGFTLQLSNSSEYEGGNLEFFGHEFDEKSREKGTLILFPSYSWHRVTEITKGTRLAMVGWVHGPSFQ